MSHHFSSNHLFYLMFTQVELIPPVYPFFYDQLPVFTEAKCTSCTAKCLTY